MSSTVFIASAARTPIGRFRGSLATIAAVELGSLAIAAALTRSQIPLDAVDEVLMGNVLSAGLGQNPARQASIGAGLGTHISATTINKVCGSGLKAVMLGDQAIRCGDANVILAGGMECMSRAPFISDSMRSGQSLGHVQLTDSILRDGLTDAFDQTHMGIFAERCASRYGLSRVLQDDFAVESYRRAREATASGQFEDELVIVEAKGKNGTTLSKDEEPERFDEGKLRQLRPAFEVEGTITAGNASSINDGAAAVVLMSESAAREASATCIAKILGHTSVAQEPEWFTLAPIAAIQQLLKQLALSVNDIDLFEINEAFACVPIAAMRELSIPHERLNVNGGAIALGHPIGASGTRLLVTLVNAMRLRNANIGVAALCIGGGEAVAMAIELVNNR